MFRRGVGMIQGKRGYIFINKLTFYVIFLGF